MTAQSDDSTAARAERFLATRPGRLLSGAWNAAPVRRARMAAARTPRNGVLHDRHRGVRCFVIGNGPSILQQDLLRLRGEVTFGLNSFFLHEQFHEIDLTYLCSSDPALTRTDRRSRWHSLQQEIDTRATVKLFDHAAERYDRRHGLFREHEVFYLRAASPMLPPLSALSTCPTDLTRPLAGHGLVLTDVALQAAFAMGVSEIYLLGFDGSEVSSFDDYVNYNFYGKDPLFTLDELRADYDTFFGNAAFSQGRDGLFEKSVACLERTFATRGVRVLNASHGRSNLVGFPRVSFDDIPV